MTYIFSRLVSQPLPAQSTQPRGS